jgi:hypothetical protein
MDITEYKVVKSVDGKDYWFSLLPFIKQLNDTLSLTSDIEEIDIICDYIVEAVANERNLAVNRIKIEEKKDKELWSKLHDK